MLLRVQMNGNTGFRFKYYLRVATLYHMGREADILTKSLKTHPLNKAWISKKFLNRFLLDEDLVDQIYNGFKYSKLPFLRLLKGFNIALWVK